MHISSVLKIDQNEHKAHSLAYFTQTFNQLTYVIKEL